MRGVALVAVVLLSAVAACEVAFPFDRSLIPEDAGPQSTAGGEDGGFVVVEDDAAPVDAGRPEGTTDGSIEADASNDAGDASSPDAGADVVADASAAADQAADTADATDLADADDAAD